MVESVVTPDGGELLTAEEALLDDDMKPKALKAERRPLPAPKG